MATIYHYTRESEDHLIVIPAVITPQQKNFDMNAALDTGASHTILDLNFMLMLGYRLLDAVDTAQVMTGAGPVHAFIFEVPHFTCLGVERTNYRLMAYDFLSLGAVDIYEGLIGLDFFQDETLCIDFKHKTIWTQPTI